jgi:Proteasome non-ATPase 26S subunit
MSTSLHSILDSVRCGSIGHAEGQRLVLSLPCSTRMDIGHHVLSYLSDLEVSRPDIKPRQAIADINDIFKRIDIVWAFQILSSTAFGDLLRLCDDIDVAGTEGGGTTIPTREYLLSTIEESSINTMGPIPSTNVELLLSVCGSFLSLPSATAAADTCAKIVIQLSRRDTDSDVTIGRMSDIAHSFESVNSVIYLRFLSMFSAICEISDDLFDKCRHAGVVDKIFATIRNDDVLTQVVALELLHTIAATDHGGLYLFESGILSWLLDLSAACIVDEQEGFNGLLGPQVCKLYNDALNPKVKLKSRSICHISACIGHVVIERNGKMHRWSSKLP